MLNEPVNWIFLSAVALIAISIIGLGILYDRERRRRIRPGFCHSCNENRVGPGETECFECWAGWQ